MAGSTNYMPILKWAAGIVGSILSSIVIFAVMNISNQVSQAVTKITEMTTQIAVLNTNLDTVNEKLTGIIADKYTSSQATSDRASINSQISSINHNIDEMKYSIADHIETPMHNGTATELAVIKQRLKQLEESTNAKSNPK